MIIDGSGAVQGPHPIPPSKTPETRKSSLPQRTARSDEAQISQEARLLEKLRKLPAIREEKVEALRKQIAEGNYETEERLQAALERFLHDGLA